jgi:hypothetical protein
MPAPEHKLERISEDHVRARRLAIILSNCKLFEINFEPSKPIHLIYRCGHPWR